jgi:hypothetical protein
MQYNGKAGGDPICVDCKIGATVVANGIVMRDTNVYGEVIQASTTGSADGFGLALESGTYATSAEAEVKTIINPFGIYRAKVAGSSTAGTALSASTYHVLTQTSASTTVVTATTAGTNFQGGSVIALTGANAGLRRVLTTVTSTTSITVTVAFPNSIAVGNKVLQLPYSLGSHKVQPTATFTEADGSVALGTGMDCAVWNLELMRPINSTNPEVFVEFILHDSIFNPID